MKYIFAVALMFVSVPVWTAANPQTNASTGTEVVLGRLPDGQPDISDLWTSAPNSGASGAAYDFELGTPAEEHQITGGGNNAKSATNARSNLPAVIEGGKIPYQPWALAVRQDNYKKNMNPTRLEDLDSHSRCLQMGVPRQHFLGAFRILQPSGLVLISETSSTRVIPLDGRPHIPAGIKLWAGDSVGHWEGSTLVVDVTNILDSGWYDWGGNFHSSDLHLVERWTVVDANTISYEAMNYDPKVFTRPWKLKNRYVRSKNGMRRRPAARIRATKAKKISK